MGQKPDFLSSELVKATVVSANCQASRLTLEKTTMPTFNLSDDNALNYEHTPPPSDSGVTFVFFNALSGDIAHWEDAVAPIVREAGHGTLVYNMRGQAGSPFTPGTVLGPELIVSDATALIAEVNPVRPVFVGLSIGGLFAAQTALGGVPAAGLVFINTLREDGPRLRWINDAVVRMAEVGGPELLRDLMSPLIMNEGWQAQNREMCLTDDGYQPIDQSTGVYNLLSSARTSNWDVPYESLTMPVLLVTGIHDRVFRDPPVVDRLAARIPNATRVDFDDAGHMVPVEQPEKLAHAMIAFAKDC